MGPTHRAPPGTRITGQTIGTALGELARLKDSEVAQADRKFSRYCTTTGYARARRQYLKFSSESKLRETAREREV